MKKLTYLQNHAKNNVLIRWPDHCIPIKFYIAPFRWYAAKQNQDSKYRQMVMEAMQLWEQASGGIIKFEIVNTLHESQINLDWRRVDRKSLGHCQYNFDDMGRLYSADLQIGLSDGIIHSKYMDDNEVFHTITHEIGHSIGLGHSDLNSADMMFIPHQYGVVRLSQNDVNSIRWLYRFPCGVNISEIAAAYSLQHTDIDEIIAILVNQNPKSQFEKTKDNINVYQKDLLDEASRIAELKKYHISLQDINISPRIKGYTKKPPL